MQKIIKMCLVLIVTRLVCLLIMSFINEIDNTLEFQFSKVRVIILFQISFIVCAILKI